MSLTSKKLIQVLTAATLITAASIAGAATASANIIGRGFGSGTTAAAAETAAKQDLESNYSGCHLPLAVYVDGSGTHWTAEADSSCLNAR